MDHGRSHFACGAIRQLSSDVTELKRMFVAPGYRGRGFARAMLHALERIAAARGYRAIRLETGVHQPEAIPLPKRRLPFDPGLRPIHQRSALPLLRKSARNALALTVRDRSLRGEA